jgi:sugar lactone lactonase YvrE
MVERWLWEDWEMKKIFKALLFVLSLFLILLIFLRLRYGGGNPYPDISINSKYAQQDLEIYFSYPEPIGNVAVTKDSSKSERVFFTVHPESRPTGIKLLEIVNEEAIPYPSLQAQRLFNTVLGVFADLQNRLWTIDHGQHGLQPVRLIAFDLKANKKIVDQTIPPEIAKTFSFFNDLSISPDGKFLAIANVSFFGKSPSICIYDIEKQIFKNRLESHPSVSHENFVPITPEKKMSFFGGLADLMVGVDGIDFSRDGEYLYYAPMGNSKLYRIKSKVILDFKSSDKELNNAIEIVATKPLSDGIRTDYNGNIYITDIENQGIYIVDKNGKGQTLIKDSRIKWADGLSLNLKGDFYLADSDIPNIMLRSKANMKENAPYHIFKFKSLKK